MPAYTAAQLTQFAKDVVQLRKLIASEVGPTHNFRFYTARLNERLAILGESK